MIDTADLPPPVCKALEQFGGMEPRVQVGWLRYEAAARLNAARGFFRHEQWPAMTFMLSLCIAFTTAANRVEESLAEA